MFPALSHGTAVTSACPVLQKMQSSGGFADADLLLPVPRLTWRVSAATPCSQTPAECRFCSLQGTFLPFQQILALACSPLPAFPGVSPHRPLGAAVFSLQREQGEGTIPSVSAIPNGLCYILLCCTGRKKDVAEHSSMSQRNEAKYLMSLLLK